MIFLAAPDLQLHDFLLRRAVGDHHVHAALVADNRLLPQESLAVDDGLEEGEEHQPPFPLQESGVPG